MFPRNLEFSVPCISDLVVFCPFEVVLPMKLRVPPKTFSLAFERVPDGARTGNSCGSWSSTISSIFRRPDVDRKSTSGGATVAILDFGGPVSPEPSETEHSYPTETFTYHAPVWRSNLPVVSTSGSELFGVKYFAPKFSFQATENCTDQTELEFLGSIRPGKEHLSHQKFRKSYGRTRRNRGFSVPCILDLDFFCRFRHRVYFTNRSNRTCYRKSDDTFSTKTHDGESSCHKMDDVT